MFDVGAFGIVDGVQGVGRRECQQIVGRGGHGAPKQLRNPRMASRIRDLMVARFADSLVETWT